MSGKVIPFYRVAVKQPKEELDDRTKRIRASLEKVNRLLAELRAINDTMNTEKPKS